MRNTLGTVLKAKDKSCRGFWGESMSTTAYCSECNARVTLTSEGLCPNGHLRPALRDVRSLPDAAQVSGIDPALRDHTGPRDGRGVTPGRAGLLALLIILLVAATLSLLSGGFLVFSSFPIPAAAGLGGVAIVIALVAGAALISLALALCFFALICYRALRTGHSPRRRWVTVALVVVALALLVPGVTIVAGFRSIAGQSTDARLHSGNVPGDYAYSLVTWDQAGLRLLGDVPLSELRPIHQRIVDTIGTGVLGFGGGTDSVELGTACTVEGPKGAGTVYVKMNPQTGKVTAVTFTPQP